MNRASKFRLAYLLRDACDGLPADPESDNDGAPPLWDLFAEGVSGAGREAFRGHHGHRWSCLTRTLPAICTGLTAGATCTAGGRCLFAPGGDGLGLAAAPLRLLFQVWRLAAVGRDPRSWCWSMDHHGRILGTRCVLVEARVFWRRWKAT